MLPFLMSKVWPWTGVIDYTTK